MIQETPNKFIIKTNHTYPPHNTQIFEEYFYDYMIKNNPKIDRFYLPIMWTNLYLSRNNGMGDMIDIQLFLNSLNRKNKYFTVLQYDDGILQDLKDLDIMVFCSGGGGQKKVPEKNLGYPIPLICKPNPTIIKNKNRDILCSFIGIIKGRHIIREKLQKNLLNKIGYFVSERLSYDRFKDVMERSIFSLCPRGYGATSFRICESLQHGSIPIYVFDKAWIPWKDEFDFNDIGILIPEKDIDKIPQIIESKTKNDIEQYRVNGEKIYKEFFDYDGCSKKIIKKIWNG